MGIGGLLDARKEENEGLVTLKTEMFYFYFFNFNTIKV
jgi:hypothetical protein